MIAVIGDIHGCLEQLKTMVIKIESRYPDISIYSVGDLIDRGPDSKGVINYCREKGIQVVKGNHELTLEWVYRHREKYSYYLDGDLKSHIDMGGKPTIESYMGKFFKEIDKADLKEKYKEALGDHLDWIISLPYFIKVDNVYISHTGYIPHTQPEIAVWNRDTYQNLPFDEFHIFGHTPHNEPIEAINYVNIDTGCCFDGGKLTAAIVDSENKKIKEFIYVN